VKVIPFLLLFRPAPRCSIDYPVLLERLNNGTAHNNIIIMNEPKEELRAGKSLDEL
jgi:hypothetical protein